ncbi:MAG TPA: hypothetical protein VHI98_29325 [Vicinamibacterales bacterium]|jgi:hypothetical protein|nr:hypothetical protein [Vicinamibacterales bacterium]
MRRLTFALVILAAGLALAPFSARGASQRFYKDDPIAREPDTQDASKVAEWEINLSSDLLLNLFTNPGDLTPDVRAQNINTIDEVPDSSWFTNRIYVKPVSLEELKRGPNTMDGPAPGRWTVIRPKTAGAAPGFTVRDEKGEVWFLSFDGKRNPRAPTAAIAVACRIFWALGYYQVESYITSIDPKNLEVAESARIRTLSGRVRQMQMKDVRHVLNRSARSSDGSYRVLAARALPGRVIGGFRFYGTRPDDPNDVVPHEHRRELRALQVFGGWTNLTDMKAGNTLDSVITEGGRSFVRHYLQDVGSSFGTGALERKDPDDGYEHLYEGAPLVKRLFTMGFYIQPWQYMPYPKAPEVVRFEGDRFEPEEWKARVPAAAVKRARADDTFWAALRVMAFTDEMIRTVVHEGQFGDPNSEKVLADALIQRRDKIGQVYLTKVNPTHKFALAGDGALSFENAAVRAGFAKPPASGYKAAWFRFDNATGQATAIGETAAPNERIPGPSGLPTGDGTFVKISISGVDPSHSSWAQPVDVYFKRAGGDWTLVGLDRLPHMNPEPMSVKKR